MNFIFKFPDIGEGIHEGRIVKWYVSKGQRIRSGEPLVKMETDKVVTDIPSPKNGIIWARFGNEGDLVNVGETLVEMALDDADSVDPTGQAGPRSEAVQEKGFGVVGSLEIAGEAAYLPAGDEGRTPEIQPGQKGRKVLATPVARAMAKEYGLNIDTLSGSGPAGRIMKADIIRAAEAGPRSVETSRTTESPRLDSQSRVSIQSLSQIRKAIARNMLRSKQSTAHMTIFEQVEVDRLVDLRRRFNEKLASQNVHLTYLPFVLKAVAASLARYPVLNSQLDMEKEQLVLHQDIHIGIAVDSADGLMVPVLRNVDKSSLSGLATQIARLAQQARERTLQLTDFQGGTFTVTNYGAFGGSYGVPVINYPQAAILGIGRIVKSPVVQNDQLAIAYTLPLSLSVDHRMVDGAESTRFLHQVMEFLAEPETLLLI